EVARPQLLGDRGPRGRDPPHGSRDAGVLRRRPRPGRDEASAIDGGLRHDDRRGQEWIRTSDRRRTQDPTGHRGRGTRRRNRCGPTFLGAHAVPPEFQTRPEAYVNLVREEMLPAIAANRLADFCDAFVDRGYFSANQAREILKRGADLGLRPKVHADELSDAGGAALAAELGAA